MKNKLTIVMDNGKQYDFFKELDFDPSEINNFVEVLQQLGFLQEHNVNSRNFIMFGTPGGENILLDEAKISSFNFQII